MQRGWEVTVHMMNLLTGTYLQHKKWLERQKEDKGKYKREGGSGKEIEREEFKT